MNQAPPNFRKGNQAFASALNEVSEYSRRHGLNPAGRTGWIESADGWIPPVFRSSALADSEVPWLLNVIDATTGQVSVDCGTIIKDAADLTAGLTITNGTSTFTPSASQWIYLKLANLSTPTATLTAGGNWTDFPSAYEITSSGSSASYAAYHFPLYHFRATAATGYTRINDGLFYRKMAPDMNLELIHAIYRAGSDRPVVVHKLIASHLVLPT